LSAPAAAPHAHRVQLRWQDIDGLGHVNHNVALTYLEEGRDAYLARCGIARDSYVVGRCEISYLAEIDPAVETVTVQCATRTLGRSSLTTDERILGADGETLVEAEFGLVLWDPSERRSRPITATERERLALSGAEG
jgi:acyl-CoA thioester hydrolase